jgi:hypothetical protein
VFWLARAELLDADTRRALEASVKAWSWRRKAAKAVIAALLVSSISAALAGARDVFFGSLGLYMLVLLMYRLRAQALHVEVDRWRRALGHDAPLIGS